MGFAPIDRSMDGGKEEAQAVLEVLFEDGFPGCILVGVGRSHGAKEWGCF